jgi:hypothetical protein
MAFSMHYNLPTRTISQLEKLRREEGKRIPEDDFFEPKRAGQHGVEKKLRRVSWNLHSMWLQGAA